MKSRHIIGGLVILVVLSAVCRLPAEAAAAAARAGEKAGTVERITVLDPEICEPFHARTRIMEIVRETGAIVVAEREIRAMDATVGGQRMVTEFFGRDGRPEPAPVFRVGEYVEIEGFLHPDGYVAALRVQRIEKPAESKAKYVPVEKSRKSQRRGAGAPRSR